MLTRISNSIAAKLAEIRKKEEEEAIKAEKEREITRRKEAKNTEEAKRKVRHL